MQHLGTGIVAILLLIASTGASAADEITDDKGCRHIIPSPKPDETVTWTGACLEGYGEGSGIQRFYGDGKLSSSYIGTLSHGLYTGQGIWTRVAGQRFEGGFVDGKREGHGVIDWPDGARYEGDFLAGEMTGKAFNKYPDGTRYEGRVLKGKPNGRGVLLTPSGDRFEGEFVLGSVTQGIWTFANGERQQVGAPTKAGVVCTQMGKPIVPTISWTGTVGYRVNAIVTADRVTRVDIEPTWGIPSAAVDAALKDVITKTLTETYLCPGNHVFVQEFVFKLGS